jgi:uncharacterized membrane protein
MTSADSVPAPAPAVARSPSNVSAAEPGRLFFALALAGFGVENVLFGHYVVARATPWPADATAQFAIACVTGAVFLACGLAILTGRFVREAGLAAAGLILAWSLLLHWPKAIAGPAWSGDWTNALKAVVLAWGGMLVAAAAPGPNPPWLASLRAAAPYAIAPFFILAGVQHVMFAPFVQTLVPSFVGFPSFWTYVAAAALLAGGIGMLVPQTRRLACSMTGWMVFSWVFLVHVTLIFTVGPQEWMGVFEALGISGVCLGIAAAAAIRDT